MNRHDIEKVFVVNHRINQSQDRVDRLSNLMNSDPIEKGVKVYFKVNTPTGPQVQTIYFPDIPSGVLEQIRQNEKNTIELKMNEFRELTNV